MSEQEQPAGKLPQIKFEREWDKLSGDSFTTIRSFEEEKARWYRSLVGQVFRVRLVRKPYTWSYGDRTLFRARLTEVKEVRPKDLEPRLLLLDVLYQGTSSGEWLERLLKMDRALLLTFTRWREGSLD